MQKAYRNRNSNSTSNRHYKSLQALFQSKLRHFCWNYVEEICSFNIANTALEQTQGLSEGAFWLFFFFFFFFFLHNKIRKYHQRGGWRPADAKIEKSITLDYLVVQNCLYAQLDFIRNLITLFDTISDMSGIRIYI